jgi:hypothetical protein
MYEPKHVCINSLRTSHYHTPALARDAAYVHASTGEYRTPAQTYLLLEGLSSSSSKPRRARGIRPVERVSSRSRLRMIASAAWRAEGDMGEYSSWSSCVLATMLVWEYGRGALPFFQYEIHRQKCCKTRSNMIRAIPYVCELTRREDCTHHGSVWCFSRNTCCFWKFMYA